MYKKIYEKCSSNEDGNENRNPFKKPKRKCKAYLRFNLSEISIKIVYWSGKIIQCIYVLLR